MAYKFQKGHADMSGSLTQLGAIIVSGTISASSGIDAGGSLSLDASAITSDGAGALTAVSFAGDGSGLTGISSDTVDTTTEAAAGTYYVPFVDQATGQDGETLRIAAALSLNPDTGAVSGSGQLQGGSIFIDSGAINSDGGGNLGVTSLGDGTATLQSGNLTGAGNVSGSGEIAGATAKFGGLNFEGNKVLTSNDGTIMFGATADQALRANSLYLSSSADIKSTLAVALASTLSGIVTMGAVDNVIPATAAGIVASDHLYFDDGANVKKVTMGGIGGYLAGNGLVADGDGVISLTAYAAPATIADADATLVAGVNWGSTTFTSDHTWTLPSAPDVGDRVVVKAPESLGGFQVFIARAGSQQIDGSATSLDLESDTAAVELIYVASNNWRVV